jgi:pyridoxal phosphate enzyme (YggS family)
MNLPMADLAERITRVREDIASVLSRIGRPEDDVTLVGITKTVQIDAVAAAYEAGLEDLGENRIQEALPKLEAVPEAHWHFVGHLQTNKARKVVGRFALVQSVDSTRIAEAISKAACETGVVQDVLLEVNSSVESSKYGVPLDEVYDLVGYVSTLPGIRIIGLMTIGPLTDDSTAIRNAFEKTRRLYDDLRSSPPDGARMDVLSMGMSMDYKLAIECGSNMVRVGTAIFGERSRG